MASTEQIQTTVNLCSTHVDLMPIANVGGFTNEPALSLAKDTLQELLASPYDWKFNTKTMPLFFTQAYRQDHLFAGAAAFTLASGVGIDLTTNNAITESGFTVTVNTLQPHNFNVGDTVFMTGNMLAAYNSTFTQNFTSSQWTGGWTILSTPSPTSFTFTHAQSGLATSGAPGILDCSWLENATLTSILDNGPAPRVWEVQAVKNLKTNNQSARPTKISLLHDGSVTGVLTLRFNYVPGQTVYAITVNYQMRAPVPASLTATWAPFPDEFGFVYRQAFLARCYRYLDHRRTDAEMQKAEAMINKALGRDDVETADQYVTPETSLMDMGEDSAWI